jgi:hypothetical protein
MTVETNLAISAATLLLSTVAAYYDAPERIVRGLLGLLLVSLAWPVGIPLIAAVFVITVINALRKPNDKTKDPQ